MVKRRFSGLMERKIRKYLSESLSCRVLVSFLLISFLIFLLRMTSPCAALVDRTVAIVGEDILTYRDIEKRYILHKLAQGTTVRMFEALGPKDEKAALKHSIRVALVINYLKRVAIESVPKDEAIDKNLSYIRGFLGPDRFERFKTYYELNERSIKRYLSENLILEDFFSKLEAISNRVTDQEVRAYYKSQKDNKFYGRSFEKLKEYIRKYLQNRNLEERIKDWIKNQKKHIKVQIIG